MSPVTAVDAFCGAGGLSLGLSQAGFDVVFGFDLDEACVSTNNGRPAPGSIRSPTFTLRFVITPSKGATTRVKASMSFRRWMLASTAFRLATACSYPLRRSSNSCCDTARWSSKPFHRSSVVFARFTDDTACWRPATACASCCCASGLLISASSSPFFTALPISFDHRSR